MKLFCACLSSVALFWVPFANGAVLDQSPYQGGNAFFESRPNAVGVWTPQGDFGRFDLPFQTYVTPVPEPGALGLVILAGCVAVTMRSRCGRDGQSGNDENCPEAVVL